VPDNDPTTYYIFRIARPDHADETAFYNGELWMWRADRHSEWVPFLGPSKWDWIMASGVEMYG
jgi:hypothetical protein